MTSNGWFFGRSTEQARVTELLDHARLITITGTGGIGKTSMALQVTEHISDRPTHWVELADIRREGPISEAIALAMGLNSVADLSGQVAADRVLVLDNCEHVLTRAAEIVPRLLAMSKGLQIIATSRLSLELDDEHIVRLEGHDDAVELFRARALAATGATPSEEGTVELCEQLDGIPLAIELAAARTRSMSPREILNVLEDDLGVIGGSAPERPLRHRRLTDTIAWSDSLLGPTTRIAFHRLSAFATDFSIDDAHAVCNDIAVSRLDLIDVLDGLVGHSLVSRVPGGGSRFRLLETIKRYGRARLGESGEYAAVENAVLDRLGASADDISERGKDRWPLEVVMDAVVAFPAFTDALERTIARDEGPERSARLLRAMFPLSLESQAGAISRLGRAFAERWPEPPGAHNSLLSNALAVGATASFTLQRYDDAERLARQAIGDSAGDQHLGHCLAQWILGRLRRERGDATGALEHFAAARRGADRDSSRSCQLQSDVFIAQATALGGDVAKAIEQLQTIRTTALHDDLLINAIHASMSEAYLSLDSDPLAARQSAESAIALAGRIGFPYVVGVNHRTLGIADLAAGDLESAAAHFRISIGFYVSGTTDDEMCSTLRWVAEYCDQIGRSSEATTIRATADAFGPRIPLICPPERPSSPSAAIDLRSTLQLVIDLLLEPVVQASTSAHDARADGSTRAGVWTHSGDHWKVGLDGSTTLLRDAKGLHDLAELLRRPGISVSAADLAGAVIEHDVGPAFDQRARREIEDRIRTCQATIDEAEELNDLGRAQLAHTELDMLVDELSAAHGLGGRARPQADSVERARSAVTARIRSVIKRIYDHDAALARHLDNCVATGRVCQYSPDVPVEWDF